MSKKYECPHCKQDTLKITAYLTGSDSVTHEAHCACQADEFGRTFPVAWLYISRNSSTKHADMAKFEARFEIKN